MNPFFFGPQARPLFGIHHPPQGPDLGCGVVLCYPIGGEYLRAHRAFRQLTNLLVRAGAHVMRFDYLGTGDSWGDPQDASVAHWVEDVGTAILELRDATGLPRVSVAGLRLGATLAARAASERADVARVVLWDPVLDGGAWLDAAQGPARSQPAPPPPAPYPPGTVGLDGFPLTPDLAAGLRALRLEGLRPQVPVDLLTSKEDPAARRLMEAWGAPGGYRCVPTAGDWAVGDRFGSALIPQAIIQGVVRCLTHG